MAQTPSTKTPGKGTRTPRQASDEAGDVSAPREDAPAPQEAAGRDGQESAPYDARPPFATAARSHLEQPANPRPPMPSTQGLWGTGAITALESLDAAMDARSVLAAENVRTERLPPVAGQFKQAALEWLKREGL